MKGGKDTGGGKGTDSGDKPEAKKPVETPPPPEIAAILEQLRAGHYDDAIAAARALTAGTKDAQIKVAASRLIGDGFRKKSDWRTATLSYQKARDLAPRNSDEYIKLDALLEILKTSQAGVYQPGGPAAGAKPAAGDSRTLADDGALADAIAHLAAAKSAKLKLRQAAIQKARTPQEVVKIFTAAAEEARQIFVIAPDADPANARELTASAGNRLQELATQAMTLLDANYQKIKTKWEGNPWNVTNVDKADARKNEDLCKALADCENAFVKAVPLCAGRGKWPEKSRLCDDSGSRTDAYDEKAHDFAWDWVTVH